MIIEHSEPIRKSAKKLDRACEPLTNSSLLTIRHLSAHQKQYSFTKSVPVWPPNPYKSSFGGGADNFLSVVCWFFGHFQASLIGPISRWRLCPQIPTCPIRLHFSAHVYCFQVTDIFEMINSKGFHFTDHSFC